MNKFNKFEESGEYSIRLMPNFFNLKEYLKEFKILNKKQSNPVPFKKHISYVLIDGEVFPTILPTKLSKYITLFMSGSIVINSNGLILGEDVESYDYDPKNNLITSRDNDLEFKDIIKLNPKNLFDVKESYLITFKNDPKFLDGENKIKFSDYIDFKFITDGVEPLYKDESSKKYITDLYNGVQKLDEFLVEYKDYNVNKDSDTIFDDDIISFLKEKRKKDEINSLKERLKELEGTTSNSDDDDLFS
jgi:hypothetical protein